MNLVVLSWVRAEKYCADSGEPMNTVLDRIRSGEWAAGKHYKRTGPRTLWINRQAADEWVTNQPHVEAAPAPSQKASRSAKASAATASA